MAGDWIKMRADLATSPKVVRIASALRADRLRVIGGLHAVWCLFDVHSTDGKLDGYTTDALDELVGFPGFASAMVSVEWLVEDGEALMAPRFDEHNGQSAKRRCMETERKREARKKSAVDADELRSREEKRREEKNKDQKPLFDAFESFWKMYPAKKGKTPARKAWAKAARSPEVIQQIMQGLANHLTCRQWTKDGGEYIPNPSSWLNQERWNDEVSHGTANTERSRPLSAVERVAAKAAERECQRQRVVEEPNDGFIEGEYSRAN